MKRWLALFLFMSIAAAHAQAPAGEPSFVNEGIVNTPIHEGWKVVVALARHPRTFPSRKPGNTHVEGCGVDAARWDRTLVRVASLGYEADPESQAMRRFFEHGNEETIKTPAARFAK